MTWISEYEEREDRVNKILTQGFLDSYKGTKKDKVYQIYLEHGGTDQHLLSCDDATAKLDEAHDGVYNCETGCDYYTLLGTITCPHGFIEHYDASGFGNLDWIFDL